MSATPSLRSVHWPADLAALPALVRARELLRGPDPVRLAGLMGTARLVVGLLLSEPSLLVVVPREKDVEPAAEDLRTLAAEIGLPGGVLPFPSPGPAPFRGLPRHADASQRRAAALHAARQGRLRALVASPAGLLRPVLAGRLFDTRVVSLEVGEEMTPEILLEALDEGGYRREDPVTAPGQIARRGGILDVFPPDAETPVRMEFLGDTLESLRTFDPATQRTTGTLQRLELLPLSDVFAPRSVLAALEGLLSERFPLAGARPLLERLERGLPAEELPELLPLVPGATVPAWEVLEGWTACAVDPEGIAAEAEVYHARAREEKERRPQVVSLEPEEALVSAAALERRIAQAPALHLREVDTEDLSLHVASRPVRRYAGDLRSLSGDLKARAGKSVLFLGSPGRAERLRDVLVEDGIPVGDTSPVEVRVGALSSGSTPRTSRSWSSPTATCSPKRCTCTAAAGCGPGASSRTSGTSRWATWSCTRTTASAATRASRPWRWAASAGSSWCSRTRAGTSSRSRWRRSTACRSTPAPKAPALSWTASAAGPGRRPNGGSGGPCGTWPRSS